MLLACQIWRNGHFELMPIFYFESFSLPLLMNVPTLLCIILSVIWKLEILALLHEKETFKLRCVVTRQLKRANLPAVTGLDCLKSSRSLDLIDKSQNTFYIKDVNSDASSVCVWWYVIHYQCILGDEGLCFLTSVLFIVSRCTFKYTRSLCCLCCAHSSDAYFTEAFEQSHCTKLM